LKGIATNRDLRFEKINSRSIVEVMTSERLVTAAVGTTLQEAEGILQQNKIEKLPVVDADYKLVGLITFRDITKLTQKPIANKDQYGRLRVAAALGVTADVLERATALVHAGVDAVIIDTAHGHTQGVVTVLKQVKEKFPHLDVVVGNIATPEAALYLVSHGADAVKVGIRTRFYLHNSCCCWSRFSSVLCCIGSSRCATRNRCSCNCRWWYSIYWEIFLKPLPQEPIVLC